MKNLLKEFIRKISRKKVVEISDGSALKKCLGLLDLTALGVGSTLGVGIYILAGQISKTEAGPSVSISFLIAAIASVFSGLSYAEFGARVPKAGSAYVYSYVCLGEFIAFIIGWSMLLSYGIGASSVAKGFTKNLNSITNGGATTFLQNFPLVENSEVFDAQVDVISLVLILGLTIILAVGVKESTILNNVLTTVNVSIVIFVLITGGIYADFGNWSISEESLEHGEYSEDCPPCESDCKGHATVCGGGGFFPFGFQGIVQGAGTAFYGFVGFDVIATLGEEVIRPQRDIPLSIVLALSVVFVSYFGISSVATLCLPYFLQDPEAPLPKVFQALGLDWAVIIIQVGAFFGLFASLLGALIPLPRVIWAMASDGLLFKTLSVVSPRFKTPMAATLLSGSLAALMAAFFNLKALVDLMSIGTLLGYTMVSICILILRYRPLTPPPEEEASFWSTLDLLNRSGAQSPSATTARLSEALTWAHGAFCVFLSILLTIYDPSNLIHNVLLGTLCLLEALLVLLLFRQPRSNPQLSFKVPFVPLFPLLSIFINTYLMVNLGIITWIQFAVYLTLGILIYLLYGLRHSIVDDHQGGEGESSVPKEAP